ncbi:hypothetical protein MJO28_005114 [Puccinia striiformis f. sp. tritici]|nr:hypothetical protein Pst134EA_009287 [Puccinia striiformis f. sp. tritici]KAI9609324.1 hypothetical protein H4Q26_007274 [Puccinia striiformis f. sp. tritici PST-130]KNE97027.1 hypothetical protein PSTG_09762 [Puccinia striiformis f. sp. tritici PST-78]POW19533.1 hypothetical protein PSHT_04559 [Puccinia striiformis]KAH9458058.1 hypothetical protein Pst134EB_010362 [Puccinia striiformis f. sp. tritici]KAH9468755.1 hypothetical protein Pst134EA_009287 [Puccinia striiformis f. sp. tritici]
MAKGKQKASGKSASAPKPRMTNKTVSEGSKAGGKRKASVPLSSNINKKSVLSSTSKSIVKHTKPCSMPRLPLKVKQSIVYWVNRIHKESPRRKAEYTDEQNEDMQTKLLECMRIFAETRVFVNPCIAPPAPKAPPPNPVYALSLVDRTFYEICRPVIWETLDFEESHLSKLRSLRANGLARNADYVRRIRWRISVPELEASQEKLGAKTPERKVQDWDENSRAIELIGILTTCTKITGLDIDLRPTQLDKDTGEFVIDKKLNEPTSRFLYPVSKLTQLTSIALTVPSICNAGSYTEQFLVRLIRDMPDLQSFECGSTNAVTPDLEGFDWPISCVSPLGLHLSKLRSLKELSLQQADCFDFTWSKIDWLGGLERLTIDGCTRATLKTIHAFTQKFSKTLRSLKLEYTEYEKDVYNDVIKPLRPMSELHTEKYRAKLPKLTTLSISTELPICFLVNFKECKNIRVIKLLMNPSISDKDLEHLLSPFTSITTSPYWPKLEKLVITIIKHSDLSALRVLALDAFYSAKNVVLERDYDDDRIECAYEDDLENLRYDMEHSEDEYETEYEDED